MHNCACHFLRRHVSCSSSTNTNTAPMCVPRNVSPVSPCPPPTPPPRCTRVTTCTRCSRACWTPTVCSRRWGSEWTPPVRRPRWGSPWMSIRSPRRPSTRSWPVLSVGWVLLRRGGGGRWGCQGVVLVVVSGSCVRSSLVLWSEGLCISMLGCLVRRMVDEIGLSVYCVNVYWWAWLFCLPLVRRMSENGATTLSLLAALLTRAP